MPSTTHRSSTEVPEASTDSISEQELQSLAADSEALNGLEIENLWQYDELRFEEPVIVKLAPNDALPALPVRRTLSLPKPRGVDVKKTESKSLKITVRSSISPKVRADEFPVVQHPPIQQELLRPVELCVPIASVEEIEENVLDDFFEDAELDSIYSHESLEWFDDSGIDSPVQVDVEGIDDEYAAYAFDPEEFYELRDDDEVLPLSSEKISWEDRAFQKATDLIYKSGWPLSAHAMVHQIFIINGWSATRLALEREISKGMTPDELILAAHIKALWAENDHYWIAFDKNGSSNLSQYILSWPSAILIVRTFEALPQVEELEQFIDSQFEYWYESAHLRQVFRSFNRFLWYRMSNLRGCLPANMPFSFGNPRDLPVEEYSDLGLDDTLDVEREGDLRAYGLIRNRHPLEPYCYFSDLPAKAEDDQIVVTVDADKAIRPQAEETVGLTPSDPAFEPRKDPTDLQEHLQLFSIEPLKENPNG
ncbi:hypothetical protein ACEN9D_14720 [Pseudomonas sp. CT11-2]|uniref:hypothetical protein n=1 Tax=Pseudomonas sp. CT11-2 TaxID=3243023 RepID=UPI0039B03EF4